MLTIAPLPPAAPRDKSKPWTPPALSVSDVQELMEQSVKSPTQIPAGPVEEEGEK